MWRNKSFLLVAVLGASVHLSACSASTANNQPAPQPAKTTLAAVSKILGRDTPPTQADFQDAIAVASEALSNDPNNSPLLRRRAKLYIHVHQYPQAITDLERAQNLKPLNPTLTLGLCMLQDRVYGYSRQAQRCYTSVAKQFAARHKLGTPPSVNYVAAAIMADSPSANHLKKMFLAAQNPDTPISGVIKQFNREKYVHTIFP